MDPFVLPEDLSGLSAEQLSELRASAQEYLASLAGSASTDEDVAAIEALAADVQTIDTRVAELATATAARAERIATALAAVTPAEVAEVEEVDVQAAADALVAEAEAVTAEAEAAVVAAVVEPAAVTRAPARQVAKAAPAPKMAPSAARTVSIVAAAGLPDIRGGQTIESLSGVVKAAVKRWESYPSASVFSGRIEDQLFTLQAPARDPKLMANGMDDQSVMAYAADQHRLKNVATGETGILAAGGWCAPAEQRFDICTLAQLDGILDVPTIGMPRGSISYFRQLDYSTVNAAIAAGQFCFTNAQLVVDPPVVKPCFEIPCAVPVDATLDACGLCLRAGLLQQKAFPELIAAWLHLALIAHAHFLNARNIAQMVAGSGAPIVMPATFGAISAFLDAVALQATNYRLDQGMAIDAPLEGVGPYWLPALFKVDQERRQFGSDDDNDWRADLAELNVRFQWVKDYQDAPFAGLGTVTARPGVVEFLLYAPGAWIRGSEDIISVSTLVDSTLLQTNRTQLLFIEAATIMLPWCGPSIRVQVPVCPSGATAGPIAATPGAISCPAA